MGTCDIPPSMERLFRPAFNLAAGISVALFFASTGLDVLTRFKSIRTVSRHWDANATRHRGPLPDRCREVELSGGWLRYEEYAPGGFRNASTTFNLSLDATAIVASCLPLLWIKYRGKIDRRANGLCTTCGYDLRATRDRCPECGMVPPGDAERGRVRRQSR